MKPSLKVTDDYGFTGRANTTLRLPGLRGTTKP